MDMVFLIGAEAIVLLSPKNFRKGAKWKLKLCLELIEKCMGFDATLISNLSTV